MSARRTAIGLVAATLVATGAGDAAGQSVPPNYSSHDAAFFSDLLSDRVWVHERPASAQAGDRGTLWGNLSPVLAGQRFGINLTMRVLPDAPPTFADLGIEAEIAAAWELCRGLTLVTGVPGSGKSTLLAAGTRRLLESGAGRVQSYEAPIEFVFDGIGGDGALMSSSEVPRHFPSFAEGLRASLRRRPAAVIVGEARDRETVEAVIRAADFGIAVFATAHTIGVAAAIRRLLAEFPAEERHERGAALIDVMTLVATQMLLPNPAGGRTAIREWLRFDGALKAVLLEAPQTRWPGLIAEVLRRTGNDLAAAANRAFGAGLIGETDQRRVLAASAGPVAAPIRA